MLGLDMLPVEGTTTVYINWRGSSHPTTAITIYSMASSNWGRCGSKIQRRSSKAANADIAKWKANGFDFRDTDTVILKNYRSHSI